MNEKKNLFGVKMALDAVMLLVLVVLYNKRAISMSFHEVGGLCVFGLFLIHTILNAKWIRSVTATLFSAATSPRLRLQWVVNVLLFLCFTLIIVTGLMITKTLPFRLDGFASAKQLHYFAAALSVVLMGVHLGLHANLFSALLKKIKFIPSKAASLMVCVLLVVSIGWGGYSLTTGCFYRWLSGPFTTASVGAPNMNLGQEHTFGENNDMNSEAAEGLPKQMKGKMNGNGHENGEGSSSGGALSILKVMAEFGSEMAVFAVLTAAAEKALCKKAPQPDKQSLLVG